MRIQRLAVTTFLLGVAAGCSGSSLPGDPDGGTEGGAGGGNRGDAVDAGGAGGGAGRPDTGAPEIAPGTSPIGGPCTLVGDCVEAPAGASLVGPQCYTPGSGFPGGYCSLRTCNATAQNCPGAGAVCVSFPSGGGGPPPTGCLAACDAVTPCRPGYRCAAFGERSGCWSGCVADADCPSGQSCARGSGEVGSCKQVEAKGVGEPCRTSSECAGAACAAEREYGYPFGYCTDSCRGDQTSCDTGRGVCVTGGGGGSGNCMRKCDTDADCRAGYRCITTGGSGPQRWCDPRCTLDSQCENMVCHAATGRC